MGGYSGRELVRLSAFGNIRLRCLRESPRADVSTWTSPTVS